MKMQFDLLSEACSKATTELCSTCFSLGIRFLHKDLRKPIYAVCGFVHLSDEVVDSFHNYDKSLLMKNFREACFNAIKRGISINPVLNSSQQVVNQYNIPHQLTDEFLRSMEMDLQEQQYTTKKYEQYILGSAKVVGLMCLKIFTGGNETEYEKLKLPAMELGSAFQKVNFLRDVSADYQELNQNYFPSANLASFSSEDKKAIEQEIREEFKAALQGIVLLPPSSKKGVYLAYVYYKKLFAKIARRQAEKFMSERIQVSNCQKFWLMFDSMIRFKLNIL